MKLPAFISDNMVLQRDIRVPLWGWDRPGQSVEVSLTGQSTRTTTDLSGRWHVELGPFEEGGPFELTVRGSETVVVRRVLIGEVWLCSGQSNMQMIVKQCEGAQDDIAEANWPEVRFFHVAQDTAFSPRDDVTGRWTICSPHSAAVFSATAFFFAKFLREKIGVPIGLIHASSGDTPAEAWISREALEAEPELRPIVEKWRASFGDKPCNEESFQHFQLEWNLAMKQAGPRDSAWYYATVEARRAGKPLTPRPLRPGGPGNKQSPSLLYNAMIAPLIPYGIRGAIWYQGETNAIQGRSLQYRKLFRTLIRSWRDSWRQTFPFLFVQLANHEDFQRERPQSGAWAELREAQQMALVEPATAMAVTIDIGHADWIHPTNKREVGRRLALAALGKVYGRAVVYSGPVYESISIEGNEIRVRFQHVEGGLVAKDGGTVKGFVIAGEDRQFVSAEAKIEGDSIVVCNPDVSKPVAVRYAWADNPECDLYNGAGLPASPFRTDEWDW